MNVHRGQLGPPIIISKGGLLWERGMWGCISMELRVIENRFRLCFPSSYTDWRGPWWDLSSGSEITKENMINSYGSVITRLQGRHWGSGLWELHGRSEMNETHEEAPQKARITPVLGWLIFRKAQDPMASLTHCGESRWCTWEAVMFPDRLRAAQVPGAWHSGTGREGTEGKWAHRSESNTQDELWVFHHLPEPWWLQILLGSRALNTAGSSCDIGL